MAASYIARSSPWMTTLTASIRGWPMKVSRLWRSTGLAGKIDILLGRGGAKAAAAAGGDDQGDGGIGFSWGREPSGKGGV